MIYWLFLEGWGTVIHYSKRFEIVELVKSFDGTTLTEISSELDIPTSMVYNHLTTVEDIGYIVNENGEYEVGIKILRDWNICKEWVGISETVRPILETVAEETGEGVWFMIEEHGKAVYVENTEGQHAIPMATSIGERGDALHRCGKSDARLPVGTTSQRYP